MKKCILLSLVCLLSPVVAGADELAVATHLVGVVGEKKKRTNFMRLVRVVKCRAHTAQSASWLRACRAKVSPWSAAWRYQNFAFTISMGTPIPRS